MLGPLQDKILPKSRETALTGVLLSPWPDLTEKNNWKFAIFRLTRRSLLWQRPGWTDNLDFFWVACKI